MNSTATDHITTYSEFVLRTMPPRPPRHQLARLRLSFADELFLDRPVVVVQAPAGFGKTSLLGQWRREHLARGAAVAWMTADEGDDLQRFLHCLVQAVRIGCRRPAFGRLLLENSGNQSGALEGITAWLAEVVQISLEIVLIIDEAERLAPANLAALAYLLHNVTPNMRVLIGARSGVDKTIADLLDFGQAISLGAEDLRFRVDEAMALVRSRFGDKIDADTAVSLHELTEGWPLGLQILMSAIEKRGSLRTALDSMAGREDGGNAAFISGLLVNLAEDDVHFLVRLAGVDLIHPDLGVALAGSAAAMERLERLIRDTPVFVVADGGEWVRLHNLVRDALRRRLAELPHEEQMEIHLRAMRWFADHGMIQEAARHAYAAGERGVAYDLAEQCLYDAVTQGHQEAVLHWLDLLPEAELNQRPRLRLAAAWALALSERHDEAEALVRDLLDSAKADASLRYEYALIASGAAYYADHPDRFIELFQPWAGVPPPVRDLRLLQMHANRQAAMAVLEGDPTRARRHIRSITHDGDRRNGYSYGARWGEFITGLSYLWEGQGLLGEEALRPALNSADADLGRRHPLASMIAALLASAVYERDRVDEAAALLANRLDVLERVGIPETVLLGYRTAARIAAAKGVEHRALDLLEVMYTVGVARHLPRLCIASLSEQVRMHAGRFRPETCLTLVQRIDELVAEHALVRGPRWRQSVELLQRLAHAHALIAAQNWQAATAALASVQGMAEAAKLGRWRIEVMALRAFTLDRAGENGRPLLLEAMNLAQTFSLSRTFVDTHPALADWIMRTVDEAGGQPRIQMARTARPVHQRPTSAPRAVPSMVLTPKERKVLEYLARNLSTKEIAQAMDVGEETVKWHLKNLFGKLDAGTRKHAVRRAQLLGLLEGGE